MNEKYIFFVNTNAIHNVPESGYNEIDVVRIVFIFVRICVLFATDYRISLPEFMDE